jgi:hypothetical protein
VRESIVEMVSVYDGVVHVICFEKRRDFGFGETHVLCDCLFECGGGGGGCGAAAFERRGGLGGRVILLRVREYLSHRGTVQMRGKQKQGGKGLRAGGGRC